MSSRRFPGKVLVPFRGRPVLDWVAAAAAEGAPDGVVLATSEHSSDDELARRGRDLGLSVYRGTLEDVFSRFQGCLHAHPCDWFFRVCADSPLLDGGLLSLAASLAAPGVDVVTNLRPRSFPRGQSVELLRSGAFASVDAARLDAEQREHATQVFYRGGPWRMRNIDSGRPDWAALSLAIDTPEDRARLEAAYPAGAPLPRWTPARSAA